MAFEKLKYRLAGGTITGNLGGKLIHFAARPGRAGGQPPPGNYDIHPPVNDPIYGMVAVMTPAGAAPGLSAASLNYGKVAGALSQKWGAPANKVVGAVSEKYGAPSGKLGFAASEKWAPSDKAGAPGWNTVKSGTPAGGQVFVLANRPIMGQNSLVITLGFADLMDALGAAGGASVQVS
jgi:hypothetical protein